MPSHSGVRVSVVLPVYNTGVYLQAALDSLDRQDLPAGQLEVIAVDDGSTDGSGQLLDEWAERRSHVTVLHQPNSGWPGQPRNSGLAHSTGDYVFFMDADDALGDEALRRLADYADEHGSDVVVPKLLSVGGARSGNDRPWGNGRVADADLERVFLTLMPQKLFRRCFLLQHDLRFPEGKVRLEDGIFLSRAYLLASRVSSLGDYDYYYKRTRAVGRNISSGVMDPHGYTESISTIARNVRELCEDAALADRIVLDLYRRKALKVFAPDRFLAYDEARRSAWTQAVSALAEEHVPVELEATLAEPHLSWSRLARAGDTAALTALAASLSEQTPSPELPLARRVLMAVGGGRRPLRTTRAARLQAELRSAQAGPQGLQVEGRVRVRGMRPAHLRLVVVLRLRGVPEQVVELRARARRLDELGWQKWEVVLATEQAAAMATGRWDVALRTVRGELEARLPVGEGRLGAALDLARRGRLAAYQTARGHLALRRTLPAAGRSAAPADGRD